MICFFTNFDWNSFWMNMLFLIIASFIIPPLVTQNLRRNNRKLIVKKVASAIQEICEFVNDIPFKEDVLNENWLIISTSKKSEASRFIGISTINVLNPIAYPLIWKVSNEYIRNLDIDSSYKILKDERIRLEDFRLKLESIISIYSLHVDENVISIISDLCLDIKAFEIKFKDNFAIDDLIEKGSTKRIGVFGIMDVADIYKKILMTLEILIRDKNFETEIKKASE